ncbi:aminotransferase class V-fold PLP-dependent enzyme [Mangrovivirga sp. M17]|uniref:Aminotransferase class V-fold PLP-dependent enzyme n=1 Tax=Mangrovivirga halotolerans TaxID=2993936 RepID=A0ABT3RV19_9BACT|nr:aminotransferase class V-fold PLP-dependent enzyme [Mangrovivirga halotolerans]MCX2745473.1 aminotransferase class V-fold PLP-dependent enzyme [Mangrovivirga halotolerans]
MKNLQKQMLSEFQDESLFKKAESFGLEFLSQALDRNVYPTEEALENLSVFDEELPENSGNAHDVIDLLHKHGSPAAVTQVGGRYFGFVNGSVVPAGLAAKNLSIFWDQNTAMQVLSPIASKLETVVQNWLIQLFGLPERTVAGFVSGTSMANFCGLAAARYRVLQNSGWDFNENGLFGAPKIRVVTGRDAHSTVLKAIALNGLGKGNIEWVDVDNEGRIIPEQIPELDNHTILILQAGNVNSGSFDDFNSICKKAREQGAWIHIDGAFGLWAGATTQLKHLTKGFEHANSWAVDGHKTLNTPYDSGIIMCDDQEALMSSLHMSGGYIIQGKDRDGMYFTPEMSRRARIIELWATLKYLGRKGIDEMVTNMHKRSIQFANEIAKEDGFSVLNEVVFNQVIVQCETDDVTDKVIEEVQNLRECWVGGSVWKGRRIIRVSICSWVTSEEDISRSVKSLIKAKKIVDDQMSMLRS